MASGMYAYSFPSSGLLSFQSFHSERLPSCKNFGCAPLELAIRDTTYGVDLTQGFLPFFLELVVRVARWRTFVFVTDFP